MRVLVTGAGGFIGRKSCEILKNRGHQVFALSNTQNNAEISTFRGRMESLLENFSPFEQFLETVQPDCVLHLAWAKASLEGRNSPTQWSINYLFTQKLVDTFARKFPKTHFVGVGSQAEYGALNCTLEPHTKTQPFSEYGKAKRAAGEYALTTLGQRASWIRVLTVYGPGDDPNKLLPYLKSCYTSGEIPQMSPGDQIWDWLYIDDAALALALACESQLSGIHVLSSGDLKSLRDISVELQQVAQARGLSAKTPKFGAKPYRNSELFFLAGNSTSFRYLTNWKPQTTIEAGLQRLLL
jgi:UDP-glucose 4-epimerase